LLQLTGALFSLHWIVVDALDGARTLAPGETLADVDRANAAAPSPWFVRFTLAAAQHLPAALSVPLGQFARFCDRLARPWREELALAEAHPSLILGFSLTTAALLATPVLNLLFR